ncbi:hypothetical protein PV08_06926 [Exophiala spinifera]|uniref:Heterokaryon incompatibility domain-containing protein n=1 Tax=Exophiala spinifera TaxID=91928 RepID=A0A0D2B629_9EURO|nr:uncharacterized protein PV08_06926 [Exophiala spinifera]KIW14145.1 hypothetical protein PV08_06926 [Exophiala spinifera]
MQKLLSSLRRHRNRKVDSSRTSKWFHLRRQRPDPPTPLTTFISPPSVITSIWSEWAQELDSPDPNLCTRCAGLKLTAAHFRLSAEEVKETANPSNIDDPITIDTREWQHIDAAKNCGLCQMIKRAVELSRLEWQSSESPNTCEIKLTLLPGHPAKTHNVRRLEIAVHYDWTSSHDISLLPVESHRCRHEETPQFRRIRDQIIVIDLEDQCLVVLPPNARYIALSYVWGQVEQPKTSKDNMESFLVILDAMEFVKMLGERYLWLDTLCIIQDDADFKEKLLNSMHTVYENAYLTLFAATGADSNAGLPGVQPSSRGALQLVTNISDGLKLVLPISYQRIKRSTWATRAWTYQEYFFAKRRLLFVDGQVVYQCNTGEWAGSRMGWEPPVLHKAVGLSVDYWTRFDFNRYVETYLDRNLSFEEDILSAFTGIIKEAEEKQLKICWGLIEKYMGLDMLWMPCKWLVRRPGFPSWCWAGWKGAVICYRESKWSTEETWLHRTSWIDWYIYRNALGKFQLLSSGYAPQQETVIAQEEELRRRLDERYQETLRTEREHDKDIVGQSGPERQTAPETGALASLLWRLCQSNSGNNAASSSREPPWPMYSCKPTINEQTLLFRTLTAYVSISSLNPRGQMSLPPRDDRLLLPSAPTLHLYAPDGTHIGAAWSHTQEFFETVRKYDKDITTLDPSAGAPRLKIEVALMAGPVEGDWRSRSERHTTWEYMLELAKAGLNLGMVSARYDKRLSYERVIAETYINMVSDRGAFVEGVERHLAASFWDELEMVIQSMHLENLYPQHCEETLRPVIDGLKTEKGGMRSKEGQKFVKVMLVGPLGDGEMVSSSGSGSSSSTGGVKERVGIGEIRDDAIGLIQGLAVRDVTLN